MPLLSSGYPITRNPNERDIDAGGAFPARPGALPADRSRVRQGTGDRLSFLDNIDFDGPDAADGKCQRGYPRTLGTVVYLDAGRAVQVVDLILVEPGRPVMLMAPLVAWAIVSKHL